VSGCLRRHRPAHPGGVPGPAPRRTGATGPGRAGMPGSHPPATRPERRIRVPLPDTDKVGVESAGPSRADTPPGRPRPMRRAGPLDAETGRAGRERTGQPCRSPGDGRLVVLDSNAMVGMQAAPDDPDAR
jgi:hypothetical protein